MTPAATMLDRFRAATPSQRCDLHAEMVRNPDLGVGFANLVRDLVESVEAIRRKMPAAPSPPRSNVLSFTGGRHA